MNYAGLCILRPYSKEASTRSTYELQKEWAFFYNGKRIENLGIDRSTSRMQSKRSTVWANPPVIENLGEKYANQKCF